MLLFGAWGGLLADRLSKRRLLIVTQAAMALPALALFALSVAGIVAPWMVYRARLRARRRQRGRQPDPAGFVIEMVGADRVVNAVSLNSVLIHVARIAGPALAGVLIATVGVEPCFALNAVTFAVMIVALRRHGSGGRCSRRRRVAREPGAVRAALRHVADTPRSRCRWR